MKEEKEFKISYLAGHATTIISVTLVLLLVGVIAMITVSAHRETRRIREGVEISVIMRDEVTDNSAKQALKQIRQFPFVKDPKFISRQEAMNQWISDTGENLVELFGVNPLSPEIEFTVPEEYSGPDALKTVINKVKKVKGVAEVVVPDAAMVETMNHNIETMSIVLGIVALVMLIISYVLINNTVRLTIYSRRFTIHTMQLVGATGEFIARPVVGNNMLAGIISGALASGIMALFMLVTPQYFGEDFADFLGWADYAWISIGLVGGGALICGLASWLATRRYLNRDYTELFK